MSGMLQPAKNLVNVDLRIRMRDRLGELIKRANAREIEKPRTRKRKKTNNTKDPQDPPAREMLRPVIGLVRKAFPEIRVPT